MERFAIIGIVIFIVISLGVIGFGIYRYITAPETVTSENDKNGKNEDPGIALGTNQLATSANESFETCPGPIELPCNEGPPGPAGNAGGIYTDKGPLRNLSQTNMVVDRMDGAGPYSNAYLAQQNYKPQQTWTLHSSVGDMSNKLSNQYGGCLEVDKLGNVNMTTQGNCKSATKWLFTSQGLLKPLNDREKCLSYTNAGIVRNVKKAGMVNLKGKDINPYSNLLKLNVTLCDTKIPLNQQWSFN